MDMGGGSWDCDIVVCVLCVVFNNFEWVVEYLYFVSVCLLFYNCKWNLWILNDIFE